MACSPFRIFKRETASKTVFYARFLDPSGKILATKALPEAKSERAARRLADALRPEIEKALVAKTAKAAPAEDVNNPDVMTYLRSFWQDDSDYVQGRRLRGVSMSAKHLKACHDQIERHAKAFLAGKRLRQVDADLLEKMVLTLAKKGTGARTINLMLQALKTAINHWYRRRREPSPLVYVEKILEHRTEKGILTIPELEKLLALEWTPRVRACVLLAALCGLRFGEAVGLQWQDVDMERRVINIVHNYVDTSEGLKNPKWNSTRVVPLPDIVKDALDTLRDMPESEHTDFVLYNQARADRPAERKWLIDGFLKMLETIGIDNATRMRRRISYHSLRHGYITLSRDAGLSPLVVQGLAGHRSSAMMDRYSHGKQTINFATAKLAIESAISGHSVDATTARISELEAELLRLRGSAVAGSAK